ncbi:hypothetical protein [Pantoea ananatis]|uniref:hypothetical protein n=1 Tax=Pantoea ananas TaxID=553 RepID=UPI001B30B82A|nr:hypothetical protein [Pantoea ananatis]
MSKSSKIMVNFRNIHDNISRIESHLSNIFDGIEDYIENLPQLKSIISHAREGNELHLNLDLFKIEIKTDTKLKLHEAFGGVSYCSEVEFFITDTFEKQKIEVLKIYITSDEYIVKDLYAEGSICQANNGYAGKLIIDLLLDALYENSLISLKPTLPNS